MQTILRHRKKECSTSTFATWTLCVLLLLEFILVLFESAVEGSGRAAVHLP